MGWKPDLDDKQKKILFISLGAIAIATVIIVPIAIELSQEKNAPRSTIDNRIECYPFSKSCLTSYSCLQETEIFEFECNRKHGEGDVRVVRVSVGTGRWPTVLLPS